MSAAHGADDNSVGVRSSSQIQPVQENSFWPKVFVIAAAVAIVIFLGFSALACVFR